MYNKEEGGDALLVNIIHNCILTAFIDECIKSELI